MTFSTCPVCTSDFGLYVMDVPTIRTQRQIPFYTCLDCHSFWNPSGYKEDEAVLRADIRYGQSVAERNRLAAGKLFDQLEAMGIRFDSVAEIGCSIGTLLTVARDRGKATIGFDVNEIATDYARVENGLDARTALWSEDTEMPKCDLYLCISVPEHIDQPRPLIKSLCAAAKRDNAALFISVPFWEREHWGFLLNPDPKAPGTFLFDNDVHVTHFSMKGMLQAVQEFGLPNAKPHYGYLWSGVLATA